jgi:transmembrane sensor
LTPRLETKFSRWLASDPANELDFERHRLAWKLAGELAQDGDIRALLADAQRPAAREPSRASRLLLACSAAAAVLVAAVGVSVYWTWPSGAQVYMTAVGEQRAIVLPDQSRMVLNTSTRVRVVFKHSAREIELDYGEATFSVTRDPHRPFVVHAAHGTARALGTEFNVYSSGTEVTIAVLAGRVEVVAPDASGGGAYSRPTVLAPGEEVIYSGTGVSEVRSAQTGRIVAWHSGRVAFEDVDLETALREFNRYGRTPIVLGDPLLAQLRVSGVFRIGEVDAFLQALNTAFDIAARRRAGAIELHLRG